LELEISARGTDRVAAGNCVVARADGNPLPPCEMSRPLSRDVSRTASRGMARAALDMPGAPFVMGARVLASGIDVIARLVAGNPDTAPAD
jgi:hypothetical protein